MKTKTVIVLTTAGILLTGSAALAVNVQTLNGPQPGTSSPANTVLLPQNSTSAAYVSPASTPGPSTVEDRSPVPSPSPSARDDAPHHASVPTSPPTTDNRTAAPAIVPAPAPARTNEPGDDHGGHGKSEPGDDKHSGGDD
ncbi:hypothetical protein ACFVTM_03290 [Arthrobacter sp. NPDC058130]|uniref:hypothetical protein n=1 Tax=Arthrobacter sp. NPDC058130 TaxID=3346353 RepID=UPI0036E29899